MKILISQAWFDFPAENTSAVVVVLNPNDSYADVHVIALEPVRFTAETDIF